MESRPRVTRWVEQGWIGPGWLRWVWAGPLAAGIALAALAVATLDGGIAYWAKHAGDAYGITQGVGPGYGYSWLGHVVAMLLLASFTVAVTVGLAMGGSSVLAFVVLAAVAVGPMTVVAAPVTVPLMLAESEPAQLWWRLLVAAVQWTILAAAAWWWIRCLRAHRRALGTRQPATSIGSAPIIVSLVAGLVIAAELLVQPFVMGQSPRPLPLLGWAALTAATTLLVSRSDRLQTAVLAFGGAGSALGMMSVAYLRDGGWPGVAGWEWSSIQSPVVVSFPTALVLLSAPLLGRIARGAALLPSRSARTLPPLNT
jgi:hypothetical protein